MFSKKNRLYIFLALACVAGYFYLGVNSVVTTTGIETCVMKNVWDIPCPSCGSTRSVMAILDGNLSGALKWNPIGFVLAGFLIICPFWILFDLSFNSRSLERVYGQTELFIKRRQVTLLFIVLIMGNWFWNILKGL